MIVRYNEKTGHVLLLPGDMNDSFMLGTLYGRVVDGHKHKIERDVDNVGMLVPMQAVSTEPTANIGSEHAITLVCTVCQRVSHDASIQDRQCCRWVAGDKPCGGVMHLRKPTTEDPAEVYANNKAADFWNHSGFGVAKDAFLRIVKDSYNAGVQHANS